MKKLLVLLAMCAGSGSVMAQKATILPFDNTLNNKLVPTFKVDSTWRVNPPAITTDKLFKQEDIDLSKIKLDGKQQPLLIAAEGYKMPILNLNNTSKMPVVVMEGYSKMPVAGKDMNKAKRATLATPVP